MRPVFSKNKSINKQIESIKRFVELNPQPANYRNVWPNWYLDYNMYIFQK